MSWDLFALLGITKIRRAIIVILIIMVVAISAFALVYSEHSSTTTSAASTTCTAIPAISYMYCPTPLRISAIGSPGASPNNESSSGGSWNFTASISSNSVSRGETILLETSLTNIGQNETIPNFVEPYINPAVFTMNGTQVWAWDPPQVTFLNSTVSSGQTITQQVSIQTSELMPGRSYLIEVMPLSIPFPTPNNNTFSLQFSVS